MIDQPTIDRILDAIIEKFQLGYCTDSHDALAKEALQKDIKKSTL